MGRTPLYSRLIPHAAIAASCSAPLIAKYIRTSQFSLAAAPPPTRAARSGESETELATTFQCPGGVSELGPSAQNSVTMRTKSERRARFGAYAFPVIGLTS